MASKIFNKIIEENFLNLKKEMPMYTQEAYRTPNSLDQKRNSSHYVIIKTANVQNKENIKSSKKKGQVIYKGRPNKIIPDLPPETMKARRFWANDIQTIREHKCQPRLQYPAKLSVSIDGETKVFHDKMKLLNIFPKIQPFEG
jgi:hypothetical protein